MSEMQPNQYDDLQRQAKKLRAQLAEIAHDHFPDDEKLIAGMSTEEAMQYMMGETARRRHDHVNTSDLWEDEEQ